MTERIQPAVQSTASTPVQANEALTELLLACLAFDEGEHTTEIMAIVQPNNFPGWYRDIADRVLAYRREHGRAPRAQLRSILADLGVDRRISSLCRKLEAFSTEGSLNPPYVVEQAHEFVDRARIRAALVQAGDMFNTASSAEEMRDLLRPVVEVPARAAGGATGVLQLDDFQRLHLPQPEMYLAPFLEAGSTTMIHGDGGMLKTMIVLEMVHGLAGMHPCMGGRWTPQWWTPSLLVDGEMAPVKLQRRIDRLPKLSNHRANGMIHVLNIRQAKAMGIEYGSLYTPAARAKLDRAIEESGAKVIFLDSLFLLFGSMPIEKEMPAWLEVHKWMNHHHDHGRSFVLIHHDAKRGKDYGSVIRQITIDYQISLSRSKASGEIGERAIDFTWEKSRDMSAEDAADFTAFFKVERCKPSRTQSGLLLYHWRTEARQRDGGAGGDSKRARAREMVGQGKTNQEIIAQTGINKSELTRIRSQG
jgi:AAA domain